MNIDACYIHWGKWHVQLIARNLLDRKGEKVRILLDAVDFPLGTINNESIGMPSWVTIVNAFIQNVHPWCQILLSTSWWDAICYRNAIVPLVKHHNGINGELPQFIIEICQLNIDKRYNEWFINNFKILHVFFLCSLICPINVSMTLDYIYISLLDRMCIYYVLDIMYHLFFIYPKGCINCNTPLVPMFNHHFLLPWCLDA